MVRQVQRLDKYSFSPPNGATKGTFVAVSHWISSLRMKLRAKASAGILISARVKGGCGSSKCGMF